MEVQGDARVAADCYRIPENKVRTLTERMEEEYGEGFLQ